MRSLLLIISIGLLCVSAYSKGTDASSWIDTVPPQVTLEPQKTYQSKVFHVTLSVNEPGSTIWFYTLGPSESRTSEKKMARYQNPIIIAEEGMTKLYYYAEDLAGNVSARDSVTYILDPRRPEITIKPESGRYRSVVTVYFHTDKPCNFYLFTGNDTTGKEIADSLLVRDSLIGYVKAVDRAGNSVSSKQLLYIVDSTSLHVSILPREGVYNRTQMLLFTLSGDGDVYYTFDPSVPTASFHHYEGPVPLMQGNTLVRYYAHGKNNWESAIGQAAYLIDTVPPVITLIRKSGADADSIELLVKKNAEIRYTDDGTVPGRGSRLYTEPVVVAHHASLTIKAMAIDAAGNSSEMLEWTNTVASAKRSTLGVSVSPQGGVFRKPIRITVTTERHATIFYTLDGSDPSIKTTLYKNEIIISRDGTTKLRLVAIDDNGNADPETVQDYVLDTKPPDMRVRITEETNQNAFKVSIYTTEDAKVYYEIGGKSPTVSSPMYDMPIILPKGRKLRYFGIDKAGNVSEIKELNEIRTPTTTVYPKAGLYSQSIKLGFTVMPGMSIYWRLLPETQFKVYTDSIPITGEGLHSLEYYSTNQIGMRSPTWRADYTIDMTPPQVIVNVRKGQKDSVIIFFKCNKNANIYYTNDGSNPLSSPTVKVLASKYYRSEDRISIYKNDNSKLAFYAEDLVGHQSDITILDVMKPQVFSSIPAGNAVKYNFIISVALSTIDEQSRIYFSRHNRIPTTDSSVFTVPIMLAASDTILAFVVNPSGFRGDIDTFIYNVDLPPVPAIAITPDSVLIGKPVQFSGSGTIDRETPVSRLLFRWDFNGDGRFDTDFSNTTTVTYTYPLPGLYYAVLEVQDENKSTATLKREVKVLPDCPQDMVAVLEKHGKAFCIDRYEWPNSAGKKPQIAVSWVVAKMSCIEAGKHLCLPEEWAAACKGISDVSYPYGNTYSAKGCPTEGDSVYTSGSFSRCVSPGVGAYDMVGNVWEWVDAKKGDYPRMLGGSFHYGKNADCTISSEGSVGTKSNEVGFRCCR